MKLPALHFFSLIFGTNTASAAMLGNFIAALAALCANFCDTDCFLSLRQVNKHWRYCVFTQKAVFNFFQLNSKWQRCFPTLIQHSKLLLGKTIWNQLYSITYSVEKERDLYLLVNFPNLRRLYLSLKNQSNIFIDASQLPDTLRELILRVPVPQSIQFGSLFPRPLCVTTLQLQFTARIEDSEMLALKGVLCQVPNLKHLSLDFLESVSRFVDTFYSALSPLSDLES